jgi:hypothetical protein
MEGLGLLRLDEGKGSSGWRIGERKMCSGRLVGRGQGGGLVAAEKRENGLWMGAAVRVFFFKGGSGDLEKMRGKGGRFFKRDGFRVRVLFVFFLMIQNCPRPPPPLFMCVGYYL